MSWLASLFQRFPELAIFLSLALGFAVGKIKLGRFRLGGVGGSLLVALLLSHTGVKIDEGFKAVFFPLFIYAVGYEVGPQFVNAMHRSALHEAGLALFLAITGLLTVVLLAKWFHLDKGLAAGIAAGGMTQSAMVGTADEAISRLGLPTAQAQALHGNVALGYAVTYVFGVIGAIVICTGILPRLLGRSIREAALSAERKLLSGGMPNDEHELPSLPRLVGRAHRVSVGAGKTVEELEERVDRTASIEYVRRRGARLSPALGLRLEADDIVIIAGRRDGVIPLGEFLGPEERDAPDSGISVVRRQVVFTAKGHNHLTLAQMRRLVGAQIKRGAYVASLTRLGNRLPIAPQTMVEHGDVFEIYGTKRDADQMASKLGYVISADDKTDFIYLGLGLLAGVLLGLSSIKLGGASVSLGTGGGALLSGIAFGWLRAKRPVFGAFPAAATSVLKDVGLAGFAAAVGLGAGQEAWLVLQRDGLKVFGLGALVTIIPLGLSAIFARYVLGFRNTAELGGALSGAQSSNFAFGEVLAQAENAVPAVPFAISYAVANIILTLLGPIIVAIV